MELIQIKVLGSPGSGPGTGSCQGNMGTLSTLERSEKKPPLLKKEKDSEEESRELSEDKSSPSIPHLELSAIFCILEGRILKGLETPVYVGTVQLSDLWGEVESVGFCTDNPY
jgi:hypothetical protein